MKAGEENAYAAFEAALTQLTNKFGKYRQNYLRSAYSESNLRLEYIDNLLRALGWDVDNSSGAPPHLREVVIENRTEESLRVKRADYVLLIGGIPKLVIEAKNPRENIDKAAFQTQNYAFNLRLYVGMATNFGDIRLYVVPSRPNKDNPFPPAPSWRLFFTEYASSAQRIWGLLSRNNVANGSIERFLQQIEKAPGRTAKQLWLLKPDQTKTVDNEFLLYLENERARLAKTLVQDNQETKWGDHGLNEAVQRIIDRVLFQRVCQDRKIDTFKKLETSLAEWRESGEPKGGLWHILVNNFRNMAAAFNGGLYGRKGQPQHFVDRLHVRDVWLRSFIEELSAEDSPYLFSTLPVAILGSVYERFLGSVVHPNGQVVQKPEVRKAGGVYYTPENIVKKIVEQTIDPLLLGKTPQQTRSLRFLDPACGSGSFLIRVFERVCEYHVEWLMAHPADQDKKICYRDRQTKDLRLTTHYKREILLNNIYGIDIDEQAVEVTQLSLYLKLLEDETNDTIMRQFDILINDPLLPDLDKNIIVANTLMADDCVGLLAADFDITSLKPISHPGIFASPRGAFHAVLGNPPYDVLEKDRLKTSWPHDIFRAYVRRTEHYKDALGGKTNLYRFFIVRSIQFLRRGGRYGMIVPLSILGDVSCTKTRAHLFNKLKNLEAYCFPQKDDPHRRVFFGAKLSTTILCGESANVPPAQRAITVHIFPGNDLRDQPKVVKFLVADLSAIDPKNVPVPLVDASEWSILRSVHTASNVIALRDVDGINITRGEINQAIYRDYITGNTSHSRLVKGVEIGPYRVNKKLSQGKQEWFNEKKFLKDHRERAVIKKRRIATQRITGIDERSRIVATIIEPPTYFADSTNSITINAGSPYSLEYILGLLNSEFYQWRFKATSTNNNVGTNELEVMPFRKIDLRAEADKAIYNKISAAVRQLLKLSTALESDGGADRRRYSALASQLKLEVDRAVEHLFGLDVAKEQPWRTWKVRSVRRGRSTSA